ncbi:MAG: pimeloyl-ACP methyl ester carboxylesterase [Maricaulis maris]|jgi:pimeloyl-ACP methyl ester carboxylesterase
MNVMEERILAHGDDGVEIRITLNRPERNWPPQPVILLVAGTGSFDEDVFFGVSGSLADLIFRDLAHRLVERGYPVVRYAKRGVNCDPNKARLFQNIEMPVDVAVVTEGSQCLDPHILAGVSTETMVQDLATAYHVAEREHPCVIVLGHSEGFANVAMAIATGEINPCGIVGIGALLESPATVLEWQMVDRVADSLNQMDQDQDGVTTNQEVRVGYARSWASVFGNMSALLAPSGAWTSEQIEAVRQAWRTMYQASRDEALAQDPGTLFEMQGRPIASYRWWQSWFTETTPVAENLKNYSGPVTFIYGDLDSQTPPERQLVAHRMAGANDDRRFVIMPGVGHTLGSHVLMGPIGDDEKERLLDEVDRLVRSVSQPH